MGSTLDGISLFSLLLFSAKPCTVGYTIFFLIVLLNVFLISYFQIFYENVKTCVEEAFGACKVEVHNATQDDLKMFDTHKITRIISSCLDELTTKGLYLLTLILTGGSVKFEKTRWKMKKVIRDHIPIVLRSQNHNHHQMEIYRQLSQLLNDPQNFRNKGMTFLTSRSQFHHAAVTNVLHGLKNLPCESLIAMYRKLKGSQAGNPQLLPRRHGWSRNYLIKQVRKTSEKMLSELGEGDELQEPLAKAMAIPGLYLKLTPGFQNSSITEFYPVSSEIRTLQNEIAKAIWVLKKKVRFPELKNLQLLLDPSAKVSNRSLRAAMRKMLTEYLFECSDMDNIPKSLREALAVINRNSRSTPLGCFRKEEIEEEVECILSVSAQTKQIVLDLLPDHDFDQDFTDAYMEELEESEDDGSDDDDNGWLQEDRRSQNSRSHYMDSENYVESTGESMPFDFKSPISTTKENGSSSFLTPGKSLNGVSVERLEPKEFTTMDSVDPHGATSSPLWESRFRSSTININTNQHKVESMSESNMHRTKGNDFCSPFSPEGRSGDNSIKRHDTECNSGVDTGNPPPFISNLSCENPQAMNDKQSTFKNQYLAIQEVCDETSMVAYNLIGHLLEGFAKIEGLDLDWRDSLYLRGDNSIEEDSQGIRSTFFFLFFPTETIFQWEHSPQQLFFYYCYYYFALFAITLQQNFLDILERRSAT